MPPLKGEVGGEAARRGQFRYKIKTRKNCSVRTPQSVLRTASSPFRGALIRSFSWLCEIGGHGSPCPYKQIDLPSVPFRGGEKHSAAVPAGILF